MNQPLVTKLGAMLSEGQPSRSGEIEIPTPPKSASTSGRLTAITPGETLRSEIHASVRQEEAWSK